MKIKNSTKKFRPFKNEKIKGIFDSYPENIRTKLMQLRELVFDVASKTKVVGKIKETLKWGQPSYITAQSKSGTTIRLDRVKSERGVYALYVHCQTPLIAKLRSMYGSAFTYEKNRAIHFNYYEDVPLVKLRNFIAMALTYHLNARNKYYGKKQ
ncbi:MAG TPA: DUF1801 domain-containing protein [Candidatus Udaeobacter sp.]|nr:DUF1801 domain-containing protein [Candidatus Udaeobacter sp.]